MFSSFFRKEQDTQVAAILDVGNGWVEAAIVHSETSSDSPKILWSHSEVFESGKVGEDVALKKAVFNALAALSLDGFKTLDSQGISGSRKVKFLQTSLHAPLTYTVARNVSIKSDKPFRVTRSLISELEVKAEEDAKKMQSSELMTKGLQLHPLSSATVALTLNGYSTKYPLQSTTSELSLCQHIGLSNIDFRAIVTEGRDKYLPSATLDADSFASLMYRAMSCLAPQNSDYLLVLVDQGATEILSVRDGLPQNSSFISSGTKSFGSDLGQRIDLGSYESSLRAMFTRFGESLSLPKTIFLSIDQQHEATCSKLLEKVTREVTGTKHSIHLVTSEFFSTEQIKDATLLSLAFVFHKRLYDEGYSDL